MKKPGRKSKAASRSVKPTVLEMRAEYDFTGGERGRYAADYALGTNIVLLDADVAAAFPDSASVNEALRAVLDVGAASKRRRVKQRPV